MNAVNGQGMKDTADDVRRVMSDDNRVFKDSVHPGLPIFTESIGLGQYLPRNVRIRYAGEIVFGRLDIEIVAVRNFAFFEFGIADFIDGIGLLCCL